MIEIIPAIDIIDGKCVRLTQGDYEKKSTYFDDPLEIALQYRDAGFRRLHMVDLDGARKSRPVNTKVLERVGRETGFDIQFGGGIKSLASAQEVLDAGANRVICGSIAVSDPELFKGILERFGGGKVILGADIKEGMVATHGWLERSSVTVADLIAKFITDGLSQVICTDISKDGMLQGPNVDLYINLKQQFPGTAVTVSGGISSLQDIHRLDELGMDSVIVGKAIYEKRISIAELASFL